MNRRSRGIVAAVVSGLLLLALGAPVAAGGAPTKTRWAWATVRRAADDYKPAAKDRRHAGGGGATVDHLATGHYTVTFHGVHAVSTTSANVALVSAFGSVPHMCGVMAWWRPANTGNEVVEVRCHRLDGVPADATFTVNWLAAEGTSGRLGFGFNWSPTSEGTTPQQAYNSTGASVFVDPRTGPAQMQFTSQGVAGGVALASASTKRRFADGDFAQACGVSGIRTVEEIHVPSNPSDDTSDKEVDVVCHAAGVDDIYIEHVVVFMKGLGLKGIVRQQAATVAALRPTSARYAPPATHQFSSAGKTNRVRRLGTGRYEVTLPGMPLGGGAQVSPFGADAHHVCMVQRIEKTARPQRVRVRCVDGAGSLVDTRFTLGYTG